MSITDIAEAVFNQVHDDFRYTSDMEQYGKREDWRSTAFADLDDEWQGDCDDHAVMCAMLFMEHGLDPKLIYCKVRTGEGHLVCGIDTDDDTLILDNRFDRMVSASFPNYEWLKSMRPSEAGTWRMII